MPAEQNNIKDIYILAIESSCDDTSCAVTKDELLLANVTANQIHSFPTRRSSDLKSVV